jgi:ZIP family zinc transporter
LSIAYPKDERSFFQLYIGLTKQNQINKNQIMTNVDDDKDHVGVAFALTFAAGAATCLGASLVFFPSLVKLASHRTLASALGLAAGVMTYVSLVEIFGEADAHFNDSGFSTAKAYLYTTLSFFAGVLIMVVRQA